MQEKIVIKRSKDADTRSAEGVPSKEQLLENSLSHIRDVNNVGKWLSQKFQENCLNHDHTKIEYIDEFHGDFVDQLTSDEKPKFKEMNWFKNRHLTERHHLNDSVPEDVNLLDVLEMVVDCTVAGLARSGEVYPITIPQEVIEQAIENTKNMIINNSEIVD